MKCATRFIPMIVALSIGLTLTLGLFWTFGQPARAEPGVIYVDANAPGSTHDGFSWTTAFTEVQSALAVDSGGAFSLQRSANSLWNDGIVGYGKRRGREELAKVHMI